MITGQRVRATGPPGHRSSCGIRHGALQRKRHAWTRRKDLGSLIVTADSWEEIMTQNSIYWERLAPHRLGEPIEFFRQGGSTLASAITRSIQ